MATNRPLGARLTTVRELGPLALLVILGIAFYIFSPAFLSTMNVSNMLSYIPELGIMAIGMTLLMTAGEFDLSVGSVFGFTPVLLFILYNNHVLPFAASFFVCLGVAVLIGFANGLLVARVRLSSFITTIGTALIVRGIALYISNGFPQATWRTENWIKPMLIGTIGEFGEFTLLSSLFWFLGMAVIAHIVLKNLQFGNWILATGGNAKAARARGVNTAWTKIGLFVVTAFLSGFAGTMDSIRVESAYPIAGTGYELEIIAMVVIGGTSLYGGRGTIIGTLIGVLLLRVIRNGIIVVGVPGLAYNIFVGGIIVFMMVLHSLYGRRTRAAED